MAGANSMAVS